ncbi:unnamed protein product, partial [Allacma fusca]
LEKAKDHPLAIISIVGKSREGKSYALNHFIRYLRSGGKDDWYQQELSAGQMFHSSDGPDPVTMGVNIWSEPFFHTHKEEEVAVLLLDCQGFYDRTLDTEKSAAIFALSSLLSSVLIYNVTTKLDTDVLEKIQEFSKYTALLSSTTDTQAGVKTALTFLVRDFKWTKHFSLGFHNKKQPSENIVNPGNYFHHIFPNSDAAGDENAILEALQACFNEIGIFLMPHPGNAFERDPDSNEPELEFRSSLREMVEYTLCHLVTKQLGSEHVTGRTFQKYVKMLAQLCQNGKFPDYPTIQRETANLKNQMAITKALDAFQSEFIKIPELTLFSEEDFKNKYQSSYNDALQLYNANKSLETKDKVLYIEKLELQCKTYFETRMVENRNKIDKRAAELALNTFRKEFANITASFCEKEFETKFYPSWEIAVKIFNSEKSSGSDEVCESEDVYIQNLKKECRNYFEKTCMNENKNKRNERAIVLATETFCEIFDRIFGLPGCNQEKKQDLTGHTDIKDADSSAPPLGSLFTRFFKQIRNMTWSEQDGLKGTEFDKLLPIALEDSIKVLKINAIVSNDDDFEKLSERLEQECTFKFYKHYKPINNDRRKMWKQRMIMLGAPTAVLAVGTAVALPVMGAVAAAGAGGTATVAAVTAALTGSAVTAGGVSVVAATAAVAGSAVAAGAVTAGTILVVNADEYGNEGPVEAVAGIDLNSPLVSNGLSDDVVSTNSEEILHLEIPDPKDSLDEAFPGLTLVRNKISELLPQIGMEFDDEINEELKHWYAEKKAKSSEKI